MSDFSLTVPEPERINQELANAQPTPAETAQTREIADLAQKKATELMAIDLSDGSSKEGLIGTFEAFGKDNMARAANRNSLLKISVGELAKAGEEGGVVSNSLLDLQREIKDLDPSVVDFAKKGFLGRFFSPVRKYFAKYQKSETVIATIIDSLEKGKDVLKNDNVTLQLEQNGLSEASQKLKNEVALGDGFDKALAAKIAEVRAAGQTDPEKIRFVEEEILFPLRQRLMDMQQTLVVNQQGVIAMEVVQRNNRELIRGVDRALNVTISALRTSVTVAGALYNQKVTLSKIQALNETTGNIISQTSKMLKEQGTEIQKSAMESTISVDILQKSFDDVIASLDEISRYKKEALPKMRETIAKFRELADKGESQIEKLERGSAAQRALAEKPAAPAVPSPAAPQSDPQDPQ
ncbi:MAG: toxic anion resistance protein [Deltaproteobacteria bacterium]|jgi:uncharacterized protein YaaN involved in tellurite resistance|nr:toxic anion resistance protein [Deltaproteobacteria bacterium]